MKKLRITALLLDNENGTPGEVGELLQHHIENEICFEDKGKSRFKVDYMKITEIKDKQKEE